MVIIGLVVGSVLVGRDMIKAAEVRATLTQVDKFNTAVNVFYGKYGAMPGDMNVATATKFGFIVGNTDCDGSQGHRDGNGLIDGTNAPYIYAQGVGETGLFWQDLSSSVAGNLIPGQFGSTSPVVCSTELTLYSNNLDSYFPGAKLGNGLYFYVYEHNGSNWYGLSDFTSVISGNLFSTTETPVTVIQAYSIDKKIDDGNPTSGNIQAMYLFSQSAIQYAPNGATDTQSTCYNNSTNMYSVSFNNGNGVNCALSFRMQAGD